MKTIESLVGKDRADFCEQYRKQADTDEDYLVVDKVPGNDWLYCVNCGIAMFVKKNGLTVIATTHNNMAATDVYECSECGNKTAISTKRWWR